MRQTIGPIAARQDQFRPVFPGFQEDVSQTQTTTLAGRLLLAYERQQQFERRAQRTGQKAPTSGIYRGNRSCPKEIALSKGKTLPPCQKVRRAVRWTLVRPTRPTR